MELYDWALYTHTKGAVKPHTLLDFMTFLPEYVYITDGKGADNTSAWNVRVMPLSFVVADDAYCDFGLLVHWDSSGVTFVVRHKDNLLYRTVGERDLPPVGHQDVLMDEIIELTGTGTAKSTRNACGEWRYTTRKATPSYSCSPTTSSSPPVPSRRQTTPSM